MVSAILVVAIPLFIMLYGGVMLISASNPRNGTQASSCSSSG